MGSVWYCNYFSSYRWFCGVFLGYIEYAYIRVAGGFQGNLYCLLVSSKILFKGRFYLKGKGNLGGNVNNLFIVDREMERVLCIGIGWLYVRRNCWNRLYWVIGKRYFVGVVFDNRIWEFQGVLDGGFLRTFYILKSWFVKVIGVLIQIQVLFIYVCFLKIMFFRSSMIFCNIFFMFFNKDFNCS